MQLHSAHIGMITILQRVLILMMLLLLLCPVSSLAEEEPEEEEDWWEESADWRGDWEEMGLFQYADLQGDTLVILDGVTTLGWVEEEEWAFEGQPYSEGELKDGPQFDRSFDGKNFRKVSLPDTLRCLGGETFIAHDFEMFTLPDSLELIADGAFVYCDFDVLRIESTLPAEVILGGLYDCSVAAYEVPEDHPLYRSVDGVLFSRDGKTLISYPNGRRDTHYDVPPGVERISDLHSDYLQTVSLPIGLKTVDDYGFSGCSRLQAVSLPLTVQKLGKNVFYGCVSLELVSLPEGLEADKDLDKRYMVYYPDDALYRGDNGDTLAGTKSTGRVNAPGRLFSPDPKESYVFDFSTRGARKQSLIPVYDTADAANAYRWYRQGKTVYMGAFENGRVALYEPLGGTYTAADGHGSILGWVRITDVAYLSPETLFEYAEVKPRSPMPVWWNHLPDYDFWTPWETVIPLEERNYKPTLFGAFVRFDDPVTHAVFGCAIQDAELTRVPDGTDQVYGIVFNPAFLEDIPLWTEPGGAELKTLVGGIQIRILAEKDGWVQITDGTDTGWVEQDYVRVVPAKQEDEEE